MGNHQILSRTTDLFILLQSDEPPWTQNTTFDISLGILYDRSILKCDGVSVITGNLHSYFGLALDQIHVKIICRLLALNWIFPEI